MAAEGKIRRPWKRILNLSEAERLARGQRARARILAEFSRARLIGRTEEALRGCWRQRDHLGF